MADWNPKANEISPEALELSDPEARREHVARRRARYEPLRAEHFDLNLLVID